MLVHGRTWPEMTAPDLTQAGGFAGTGTWLLTAPRCVVQDEEGQEITAKKAFAEAAGERLVCENTSPLLLAEVNKSTGDNLHGFVFFPHYLLLFLTGTSPKCRVGKTPVVCPALMNADAGEVLP